MQELLRVGWQGRGALALLALFGAGCGSVQTLEEAQTTYERGEYAVGFDTFSPLAGMYWEGPQDDVEAVRWYRLAAEQGDARAQFELGFRYEAGRGVPQDDAEAIRWYRAAADQGEAFAQNNLGMKYGQGRGVPQDDAEAIRWYRAAADQGLAPCAV